MSDQEHQDEAMNTLSEAIIKAILHSKEVKGVVMSLLKQGMLCPNDVLALALKFPSVGIMEAKMGQLKRDQASSEETRAAPPEAAAEQFIDGKKLSPAEWAFEEYCAGRFNEEAWIKKARIQLD
ncbi:MAG: hypothetical protein ACE5JJ_06425 [Nitrospinota bacterium]